MAGVGGAKPGIIMQAEPKVGQTYRQEDATGVAEGTARVGSLSARRGALRHVPRRATEARDLAAGAGRQEGQVHAPGVGQVLAVDLETGEREELVDVRRAR